MTMDLRKIEKIIELIEHTDISEIEIREGENSVRLQRGSNNLVTIAPTATPTLTANTTAALPVTEAKTDAVKEHQHYVRSPMVGTFYIAPTRDAKPFVSIGQSVKNGDVLCIVEAMKMMNQIEADKDGIVIARLVENAMPVEFDQPLFIIE